MTAPDEPCVCGTEFGHDCLAGERLAEQIAFGMYVLQAPIFDDHAKTWAGMDEKKRAGWIARGRFVANYVAEPDA